MQLHREQHRQQLSATCSCSNSRYSAQCHSGPGVESTRPLLRRGSEREIINGREGGREKDAETHKNHKKKKKVTVGLQSVVSFTPFFIQVFLLLYLLRTAGFSFDSFSLFPQLSAAVIRPVLYGLTAGSGVCAGFIFRLVFVFSSSQISPCVSSVRPGHTPMHLESRTS